MKGEVWGHHKSIKIVRLNKSPQCDEGSTLIDGVDLYELSLRDGLEELYLAIVCICLAFNVLLFIVEPRWMKLKHCTTCLIHSRSKWWPGSSVIFNITVLVLYTLLIPVCLTDQYVMSHMICVTKGDTDFNQVTMNMLTAELLQQRRDNILLLIGYMVSAKFCTIAFVNLYSIFRQLFGYILIILIFAFGFSFVLHGKFGVQLTEYDGIWSSLMMMYLAFVGEMEQMSIVELSPFYGRLLCSVIDFVFPMFLFNIIVDILVDSIKEDEEARKVELLPFTKPDARGTCFTAKLEQLLRRSRRGS